MKINRLECHVINYNWSEDPNHYLDQILEETLQFGCGNFMIKDCMSWFGVSEMRNAAGRMNSDRLFNVLDTFFWFQASIE